MKKQTQLYFAVTLLLLSCSNMAFSQAKDLIDKHQCLACHATKNKVIGPSFQEIAKRYGSKKNDKATIVQLSKKIKEGGSGVWGPMPMTPHPDISEKDTEEMVKWILNTPQ